MTSTLRAREVDILTLELLAEFLELPPLNRFPSPPLAAPTPIAPAFARPPPVAFTLPSSSIIGVCILDGDVRPLEELWWVHDTLRDTCASDSCLTCFRKQTPLCVLVCLFYFCACSAHLCERQREGGRAYETAHHRYRSYL